MIALLFALLLPRDTVLVSVELVETSDRVTVEAIIEADSTLLLPAQALRDLTGASFAAPWVALDQLRAQYPTLTVQWRPAEMRILVFDEVGVLPAVRRFHESHRASAFRVAQIPQVSGLFGSFAIDGDKRALAELGYTYRGRASVFSRVDDRGATQWNAFLAPTPRLFLGASGGTGQPTQVSGRVTAGPLWVLTSYVPRHPLEVASLVHRGPVQAFASTTFGTLTISPPGQWAVQLATRWRDHQTVGRIAFGPAAASPFTFPQSVLSH